ncbi:response regulator [Methanogenium marinum]|uniref:Response regulator n=1 Tax=Methanogenium marinum TaxID=348610 RepID=A0A9Q4PVN9_9EURY|nr:response regulator [Methanogenium marinum]MDE4907764.1 response regulator [Methanogenium marinum]
MYAILYVDDEESLLDLGKIFIEKIGDFSVDTVISAKIALEVLETKKYDAIISDYQMPGMDGIAFLKHLRKTSDVPFILFTGKGREEIVIEALNSGANSYLQKGGEPKSQFTQLVHILDHAISRKKAEEAQKLAEQDLVRLNEEMRKKLEEEKVISEFSQVLLNAGTIAEILDYFGNVVFSRSGANYLMLSKWDPDENAVVIHSLIGFGPHLEQIGKLAHAAPESLKVPIAVINAYKNTMPTEPELHKLDGGIHAISRGTLPKTVCTAIEKILGVQTISIYELVREGNLYGGVTFGFRQGHEIQNQSLIITLSNILANGLWRVYSTNAIVHDREALRTSEMKFRSMLENMQPDTSSNTYFQEIATAAEHISSMIEFTKEYERIGVNAPTWQDCRTLVDTAAKQAPLGEVMVKNDLPADATVFADPLIARVFYNLMDNAVRYGGKITTIQFLAEERNGNLILVCEDNGHGIIPEEKEKIFERGFGKNTGMGLFLTREILSITGITTHETGEPGNGARFEITVPHGAYQIPDTK